jgi:hypothetical protein
MLSNPYHWVSLVYMMMLFASRRTYLY